MSLFAIRRSSLGGVYSFQTKEEYAAMQKIVKGCSCRIFNDEELESALLWANVNRVSSYTELLINAKSPDASRQNGESVFSNLLSAATGKKPGGVQSPTKNIPVSNATPAVPDNGDNTSIKYVCTGCGAVSIKSARFCTECGAPMREEIPQPVINTETESNSPVPMPKNDEWICSQGHTNPNGASFCMECGERKPAVTEPTILPEPIPPADIIDPIPESVTEETITIPEPEQPVTEPINTVASEADKSDDAPVHSSDNSSDTSDDDENENALQKAEHSLVSSFDESDVSRITSKITTGGCLKEILRSYAMLGVPLVCISLASGQKAYVVLSNLYYGAEGVENACITRAKDDPQIEMPNTAKIQEAVGKSEITKICSSYIFPREDYLFLDSCHFNDINSIGDTEKHITYIIKENIVTIRDVAPPEFLNGKKLISNKELILELEKIL